MEAREDKDQKNPFGKKLSPREIYEQNQKVLKKLAEFVAKEKEKEK